MLISCDCEQLETLEPPYSKSLLERLEACLKSSKLKALSWSTFDWTTSRSKSFSDLLIISCAWNLECSLGKEFGFQVVLEIRNRAQLKLQAENPWKSEVWQRSEFLSFWLVFVLLEPQSFGTPVWKGREAFELAGILLETRLSQSNCAHFEFVDAKRLKEESCAVLKLKARILLKIFTLTRPVYA